MTLGLADILPAPITLWQGLDEVPENLGRCVFTLGVFDGVHRGHARLIDHAVRLGRARGLPTVLVTFDPHPARVVGRPRDTSTLTSVHRRAELAGELGVDAVLSLSFTRQVAALTPEDFVRDILAGRLNADGVVVGSNFTFGAHCAGTVETLHDLGVIYGFTTEGVGLLHATDVPCSSTHTRACLRDGDIAGANHALGRPHQVEGHRRSVEVTVAPGTAMPRPGTYRARIASAGLTAPGVVPVEVVDERRLRVHGEYLGCQGNVDAPVMVAFLP